MRISDWSSDVCSSDLARAILQGSDYYARLNRAALLAFRSKYAITLYEMGCLLAGRRNPTWSGTVDELRERLGAPSNSMPNFSDFRRLVLTPGKAEIDQLAAFTMDRSEEHTSELQSLMRTSYAVFCLKKKHHQKPVTHIDM